MSEKKKRKYIKCRHKWSDEEIQYLRDNAKGKLLNELTSIFNYRFGHKLTPTQVRGALSRNDIRMETRASWTVDIGTEYLNKAGYVEIKVSKDKWVFKHVYIYEKHFGKIQGDNQVIFLDGDKTNFNIDNLKEVTRAQVIVMNRLRLRSSNAELTKTGIHIANLIIKANEMKKNTKQLIK